MVCYQSTNQGALTQILWWGASMGRGKCMCCRKFEISAVIALDLEENT